MIIMITIVVAIATVVATVLLVAAVATKGNGDRPGCSAPRPRLLGTARAASEKERTLREGEL